MQEKREPHEKLSLKDWIMYNRFGDWVTVKEAAKMFKYSESNIRYLVNHKNCIIVHKKGRDLLINRESFMEFERLRKLLK